MTNQNTNVLSSNKISNNIFSNNSINLSQEDISQIQISSNILKNINLSEVQSFSTILRSYKSEQNRNVLNAQEIQNTQNIFNKFDKNFKISNISKSLPATFKFFLAPNEFLLILILYSIYLDIKIPYLV